MFGYLRSASTMFLLLSLLAGVIYPALVTLYAQWCFPDQANGSLIMDGHGQTIGSALIGQSFSDRKYFWGRPSATSPYAYNAGASSGSNLGPTNPALVEAVAARVQILRDADPANKSPVPVDLVTASGSGLDPHISPAAAQYQLKRVAKARHMAEKDLQALIVKHTEPPQWGLFGESRVNVLLLNLALDALQAGE